VLHLSYPHACMRRAGDTPLLYDTRQWYCHDSPGYPLGEIKIGNLGSQIYYARSSNIWIKHECDLVDECGPLSPRMLTTSRTHMFVQACIRLHRLLTSLVLLPYHSPRALPLSTMPPFAPPVFSLGNPLEDPDAQCQNVTAKLVAGVPNSGPV
jgi:hypothetical protein